MRKQTGTLLLAMALGCLVPRMGGEASAASPGWESLGEATFMDGWLLPAIGLDQTKESNWYKVELEKSTSNDNLYRLVNPYKSGPMAEYNRSTDDGYIEFDVTDPDHVVVNWNLQRAGFVNAEMGISEFYCYNTLTYFGNYLYKGYSPEEIVETVGDQMVYTTFEDGVITLGRYVDPDPEFSYSYYDARFGLQDAVTAGRNWTNALGMPSNMTTKVFFPEASGVEETMAEKDAPEVYYDISGAKVESPQRGRLYIVRQGDKSRKIIY